VECKSFETVFNHLCSPNNKVAKVHAEQLVVGTTRLHSRRSHLHKISVLILCNLVVLYADIHAILSKYYQSYLMAPHIYDLRVIHLRVIRSNVSLMIPSVSFITKSMNGC